MTHGKTYNKSPRRINHKATKSKTEQNRRTEQNFIINTQVYTDIWGYTQVYYIETWWHIHLHVNGNVSPPRRFPPPLLVVSPLVVSPPFWSPSRFGPPPPHLVVSPPNHFPLFFFFFFFYKRFINSMWDREKGRERAEHVLWMKMLMRNYDKYYLFWSIPLITLFIWFDSLITQLMRLMMRCENTRSLQS